MTKTQAKSTLTTEKNLTISWFSNSPFYATGYGCQTRLFVPRLQKAGYSMSISSFAGLSGHTLDWVDGIKIYPNARHRYGQDVLEQHAKTAKADVVISLMDAWVCEPDQFPNTKWIPWFPIDSHPITTGNAEAVKQAYKRIVISKHGAKMMDDAGMDYDYIPHGVDTDVFKPLDRSEVRAKIDFPEDKFIVGMVAANVGFPPRKAFAENISAFKMLHDKHPDTMLYLHTADGTRGEGFDIPAFCQFIGLEIGKDVILANQYHYASLSYPDGAMNLLYNAMDVHLLCSKGEGFGIPILEAQAAGCPVIVGDWSSMGELCFSGWKLDRDTEAEPEYTQYGAYWFVPHIGAIYQKLENAYQKKGNKIYRERARAGAMAYDADLIVKDFWVPYLDKLAEEVHDPVKGHMHKWGKTGLYNPDGSMSVPCLGCNDEMKGNEIIKDGFASNIGLDLVPDSDGLTKIISREIEKDYKLDNLDLKAGDVVIDIGAHKGIVSCYLAKKYPGIKVIAFEPNEENYNAMIENIERNKLEGITAELCAITKNGRNVTVSTDKNNSGGGMIFDGGEVPSTTLENVFKTYEIDRVALLKSDCEGSEFEIFENAIDLLKRVDAFRGEIHRGAGDADKLLAAIKQRVTNTIVTIQG